MLIFYIFWWISDGEQDLGSQSPVQLAVSPSLSVGVDLLTSLFDDKGQKIR